MKLFLAASVSLCLGIPLFAQSGYQQFTLSSNPSALELTQLFTETTQGIHDPFVVLRQISAMGDTVVPALKTFLLATPTLKVATVDLNGKTDTVPAPPPNRVYGVMALDLIGTPLAYQTLAIIAQSDSDEEVRGTALKVFATSYYFKTQQDSTLPEKEAVHLLLRNVDDTTYVYDCVMRIGEIARAGLTNWTGVDYGEIPPDSIKTKTEKKLGKTMTQYREEWWQQHSTNMKWNKATGHFEVKQ